MNLEVRRGVQRRTIKSDKFEVTDDLSINLKYIF